jgi:hypothetical protein
MIRSCLLKGLYFDLILYLCDHPTRTSDLDPTLYLKGSTPSLKTHGIKSPYTPIQPTGLAFLSSPDVLVVWCAYRFTLENPD